MRRTALAAAAVSLGAWSWLALRRGGFWRANVDELSDAGEAGPAFAPRVEVVIPARNEAAAIGRTVRSLLAQRYAGPLNVTLVDDDSYDWTIAEAQAAAVEANANAASAAAGGFAFDVVAGRALAAGWTGKLNALDTGVAHVRGARGTPDYWLFTDADIEHHAENVSELVRKAVRDDLDLVSLMVRLRCENGWERLLVPAFIFFFRKLYPFAWSNDPRHETAAAAGGCMLVRSEALERIGGFDAIADRLIDDCALANAIKDSGGTIWLGLSTKTSSTRPYESLGTFWKMVKRSAFTQLNHSYATVAGTAVAMTLLYVVPPSLAAVAAVRRDSILLAISGATCVLIATLFAPTLRAYERPLREAALLPVAAALYSAMTVDSAVAHARGRGGRWKGRLGGTAVPMAAPAVP